MKAARTKLRMTAGSGEFDGGGGAEEESGADGTADGDHGHLSGGELAPEAGLGVRGWSGHEGSYSYIRSGGLAAEKRWRAGAELRSAWTAEAAVPAQPLSPP